MTLAIISDIHSNVFALKAVLDDIGKKGINKLIVAGDLFGYYPWALETYQLLAPFTHNGYFIKGNHDQLLLDSNPPHPVPSYWQVAKHNAQELLLHAPEALEWLKTLVFEREIVLENKKITIVHGTPDNPFNGRYYPDDNNDYPWLPAEGEILVMGHTHYPITRCIPSGGMIVNPGSVGQPRDGSPMPSWVYLDVTTLECITHRVAYDYSSAMNQLRMMEWNERFIQALNKTKPGIL